MNECHKWKSNTKFYTSTSLSVKWVFRCLFEISECNVTLFQKKTIDIKMMSDKYIKYLQHQEIITIGFVLMKCKIDYQYSMLNGKIIFRSPSLQPYQSR